MWDVLPGVICLLVVSRRDTCSSLEGSSHAHLQASDFSVGQIMMVVGLSSCA